VVVSIPLLPYVPAKAAAEVPVACVAVFAFGAEDDDVAFGAVPVCSVVVLALETLFMVTPAPAPVEDEDTVMVVFGFGLGGVDETACAM